MPNNEFHGLQGPPAETPEDLLPLIRRGRNPTRSDLTFSHRPPINRNQVQTNSVVGQRDRAAPALRAATPEDLLPLNRCGHDPTQIDRTSSLLPPINRGQVQANSIGQRHRAPPQPASGPLPPVDGRRRGPACDP